MPGERSAAPAFTARQNAKASEIPKIKSFFIF
jgi:hypothetical protein